MILCGKEIVKHDVVIFNISCPSGWIPSRTPVCLVESTNKRKGIIIVKYRGVSGISIPINGILGVKVVNHVGTNKYFLCGEDYSANSAICIDNVVYKLLGLVENSNGQICVKLSKSGEDYVYPVEQLSSHSIRKVEKDEFINPLVPGVLGRSPIIHNGEVVGINFGFSTLKGEFVTLETGVEFINILNGNMSPFRVDKKADLQLAQFTKFIINPAVFRKFSVTINKDIDCGLKPGEYTCYGFSNRDCESELKRLISESSDVYKIINIPQVSFLFKEDFMACYNWNVGWFYILLNSEEMKGAIKCIESAMVNKTLAVIPKPSGKSGFGLIFLEKYFSWKELKHLHKI